MKYAPLLLFVVLLACNKKIDVVAPASPLQQLPAIAQKTTRQKPEVCSFGLKVVNKTRRTTVNNNAAKTKPGNGVPATADATIFLDLDGQLVSNSLWNTAGDIKCAPANLMESEVERILTRVSEDFSPFDVNVTTDEAVYNATSPHKRIRVILTESWEWFGVVGGTAFINSFGSENTPAFIFTTLLQYNEKYIAEAISHEVGHTLNLQHQALFDAGGSLISEYNDGTGSGVRGWAPIMGTGYYKNVTTWHKGPSALGYNNIQDDVKMISSKLPLKVDTNDDINKKQDLSTSTAGIINNRKDADFYFIDVKRTSTVMASPQCVENEEGANLCLKMNLYDKKGVFIRTVKDPLQLSASTTLTKGKYYIGIESVASENQSRYGMLGRYRVTVQ
jgi:hypothetical protein